jgi:hypothetical protein
LRATGITLPEIELPPLEACELRDGEEKKDA